MALTKIINVSKSDDFEDVFDLFKNTDAEDVIFIFPKGSRFVKQERYFEAIKEEADSSGKSISIMSADPAVIEFASKYGFDVLEKRSPHTQSLSPHYSYTSVGMSVGASPARGEPAESAEPKRQQPIVDEEDKEPEIPVLPPEPETDYSVLATPVASLAARFAESRRESRRADFPENEFADGEPEAVLTAAADENEQEEPGVGLARGALPIGQRPRAMAEGRTIKDILSTRPDRSLKIKEERERTFDIDIQRRAEQEEMQRGDIAKIWAGEKQRKDANFLNGQTGKRLSRGFFRRVPFILAIGAILVLVFILYLTLGSARIIISPVKQELNDLKLKVSASSTATAVNFNFNQIPGQQFTEQKKETGTFPVTGQKDVVQKAGGTITIFNKGATAQRLVATTRFKSPDGLIFRIPQTINVPAGVKTGATITPGSIVSAVYADRPGAEYNIGPTQFTIPGFEGTPKFNDFYATSDKPMTGGIVGPAKVVTEKDFTTAQEELAAKVRDEILKSLKDRGGELKILDAVAIKLDAPEVNAKVGEAAEELEMSLQGSADTIAFRESDVIELIKNFVSQKNDMELLLKDLAISYVNPQPGADKTLLSFDAQINGLAAAKLDTEAIKSDVRGMSEDSIRSYLKGIKEIESARIMLSPFWTRSIPKNAGKIKIDIQN